MSSFSMFGTCQGCGLTQYMQGQPCRDCGDTVQQGGVAEYRADMRRKHVARTQQYPTQHQLVQEYNGVDVRAVTQIRAAIMDQYTAFLDRAVHDCLSRLGLTLAEAVQRLTRHMGPSWEELYLDGERVLRLDWEYVGERGFCMTRKFHGPAELPAT